MREAVINAVIHKDYASGSPIQISVYEDRLMIWNSEYLPDEWDISTLLGKHSSEPCNPDIANAFFRAGTIESWGRGIEHITQSCEDTGVSLPEFSYEHTGLWARFSFATSDAGETETTQETTQESKHRGSTKSGYWEVLKK